MAEPPVHPRTRGERPQEIPSGSRPDGSSPHTRGTLFFLIFSPRTLRFIPAHAGNARWPLVNAQGRRFIPAHAGNAVVGDCVIPSRSVHPRTRGERAPKLVLVEPENGSSPHTRGTLGRCKISLGHGRFIPAHAGNASCPEGEERMKTVHPRTRGERKLNYLCA